MPTKILYPERYKKFVEYVWEYFCTKGKPPSLRYVAIKLNVSISVANYMRAKLVKTGEIEYKSGAIFPKGLQAKIVKLALKEKEQLDADETSFT